MSERKDELVEKIVEEVKKKKISCKSPEAQGPCCGGKTPVERRWNVEEKDKPAQAYNQGKKKMKRPEPFGSGRVFI